MQVTPMGSCLVFQLMNRETDNHESKDALRLNNAHTLQSYNVVLLYKFVFFSESDCIQSSGSYTLIRLTNIILYVFFLIFF